ncbi:MAG: hypothetical protein EOO88_54480, partial [Pedobacter sp.]
MRFRSLLLVVITSISLFSACNKNAVTLAYTNAKGEVPLLGNFTFRFNQGMMADSLLNVWDSTDYISFEPAIKGRFRWESPDELIFSPSQPLNPATSYTAKVKDGVLKYSKFNSVKDGDKISFHTPDLALENSQIVWIGESSTTAVPQVDLVFNYKVDPADIKDKLTLEVEGKQASFNLVTMSPDNKISIRITGLKTEDKDYDAKVSLSKGVRPQGGANTTAEPIVSNLSIPSPFVLTIQNLDAEHDGSEGLIHVTTSQQL